MIFSSVDEIDARENGVRWDGRGRGLGGVRSQWGGDVGGIIWEGRVGGMCPYASGMELLYPYCVR